jgi:hypothetical protein
LKTKSSRDNALCGGCQLGSFIDDGGIFAAHFENSALEPFLTGMDPRSLFVYSCTYRARPGEIDKARAGMLHHPCPDNFARRGQIIQHASRQAIFPE